MGNSPSFEGALQPRLLTLQKKCTWSQKRLDKVSGVHPRVEVAKSQQDEDVDGVPLAAGCATVSEFLWERERYLNFGASRYLLYYPRSDGSDLLQCILQLERWRHEAITFRQGQRRFEDLTLFQVACWAGKSALVEKYLSAGVPVNQPIEVGEFAGCSPLHLALAGGCGADARLATVIRVLLRYGSDVGHRNGSGNTPLHLLLSLDGPIDMQLLRLMTRYVENLRCLTVDVSTESCRENEAPEFRKYLAYTSFCAGWANGTGVCNGDSGGGLMLQRPDSDIWDIYGIVSLSPRRRGAAGSDLCDLNYYTVFTKVSAYLGWLQKMIEANSVADDASAGDNDAMPNHDSLQLD